MSRSRRRNRRRKSRKNLKSLQQRRKSTKRRKRTRKNRRKSRFICSVSFLYFCNAVPVLCQRCPNTLGHLPQKAYLDKTTRGCNKDCRWDRFQIVVTWDVTSTTSTPTSNHYNHASHSGHFIALSNLRNAHVHFSPISSPCARY